MNPAGSRLTRSDSSPGLLACGLLLAGVLCGGQAAAWPATAEDGGRPKTAVASQFILRIEGAIHAPDGGQILQLDLAALQALPQQTVATHTPWHDGKVNFSGPRLWDLLEPLKPAGKTLRVTALNDYSVNIPLSDLQRYQPVLAWQLNGKALSVRNKGPLFLMYPFDAYPELQNQLYHGRAIWQIKMITVE